MKPLAVLLALAFVVAVAPPAVAQSAEDRALVERGRSLRRAGQNAEALAVFRQSYARRPTPELAGQMGFAEHALQQWSDAYAHLRESLSATGDPWVLAQRQALEFSSREVERHLGSLRIESNAAGAELSVNGAVVGTLPMNAPLRVAEGTVRLSLSAPGYRDDRREITVSAGETVRVVVQLPPVGSVSTGPAVITDNGLHHERRDPPTPVRPPSNTQRILGWVSVGFAAVGFGGALAGYVLHEDAAARWNDDALCLRGGRTREQNCARHRDEALTAQNLMIAGFAVGGTLAIGVVLLFATAPSRGERPVVGVTVGNGNVGATLGGRF